LIKGASLAAMPLRALSYEWRCSQHIC